MAMDETRRDREKRNFVGLLALTPALSKIGQGQAITVRALLIYLC